MYRYFLVLVMLVACGRSASADTSKRGAKVAPSVAPAVVPKPAASAAVPQQLASKSFPLPGAKGPVTLDYIVYEPVRARVWVPVGDTGSVYVFEIASNTFTQVAGFKTAEREAHGKKRMMGPSAATVGEGFVYIGNRATGEVCAIDQKALKLGACLTLQALTDGVVYVASTKEVWVTTPRDSSLTVLDASKPAVLAPKLVIKTEGEPEGYAVDAAHGLFYTNLEDRDRTLAIDLKTHAIKSTWSAGCGASGPRGVTVDPVRNFVFVACTESVRVLDGAQGKVLGTLDTGAGVDNLEYDQRSKLLYVAAARVARLTIAKLDDKGKPSIVATGATAEGTRNAVVDSSGKTYAADPQGARLFVFDAP
jgi:DNA-binding beta-propeller fold protein YncE